MLDKAKNALRIKTDVFDGEVEGLISAAFADLRLAGIMPTEYDPLTERAVILYCKANFGFNEDSERFLKAYDHLKIALSLAGGHHV